MTLNPAQLDILYDFIDRHDISENSIPEHIDAQETETSEFVQDFVSTFIPEDQSIDPRQVHETLYELSYYMDLAGTQNVFQGLYGNCPSNFSSILCEVPFQNFHLEETTPIRHTEYGERILRAMMRIGRADEQLGEALFDMFVQDRIVLLNDVFVMRNGDYTVQEEAFIDARRPDTIIVTTNMFSGVNIIWPGQESNGINGTESSYGRIVRRFSNCNAHIEEFLAHEYYHTRQFDAHDHINTYLNEDSERPHGFYYAFMLHQGLQILLSENFGINNPNSERHYEDQIQAENLFHYVAHISSRTIEGEAMGEGERILREICPNVNTPDGYFPPVIRRIHN